VYAARPNSGKNATTPLSSAMGVGEAGSLLWKIDCGFVRRIPMPQRGSGFCVETDHQKAIAFAGRYVDAAFRYNRRRLPERNRSFPNDVF
jgi:hypothetical protein